MSGAPTRVFVARLAGLAVFDPIGDQVGRVRDVVVVFRAARQAPAAVGLVVEVPGRRRVFVPMTRVTSIDGGQVITTGLVNMRRFEQRSTEVLVLGELLDRQVRLLDPGDGPAEAVVEDVALEQQRNREWRVTKLFVRRGGDRGGLARGPLALGRRRRGETMLLELDQVAGLARLPEGAPQGAASLLAAFSELKAADLAEVIHELKPQRRLEVASALDDERLADVLEELPEDDRVAIIHQLAGERAADVLEEMQPDDAADLLAELPPEQAERLLALMEPDEAEPVRTLMAYAEDTAGGLMTSEPVILGPEASVAEALALVRREELPPAVAASVYVCRPPLEVPTGRYLGLVHTQRLLREPPHELVGGLLDKELEPLPADAPLSRVSRVLATYNLVGVPVTDDDGRLLGAVTVDDVLDHLLPDDWRDEPAAPRRPTAARRRPLQRRGSSRG